MRIFAHDVTSSTRESRRRRWKSEAPEDARGTRRRPLCLCGLGSLSEETPMTRAKMIRKWLLMLAAPLMFLAPPAFAQDAPDALVKRVADDVLATIRADKDIQ